QTGRRSDLRSKSADSECLLNCVSCFAAEQFIGIIRSFKGRKAGRACTPRLLNLEPAKQEEGAIYAVNQRILSVC
ncbi:hypothetical protein, partial [Blautia sp. OF03-15BH]|uniref:hypothetical protein n=1 Tax=Blautia sp. OF03-15BH TaxID=2292287 RepID=UPI001A9A437B